MNKWKFLIIFFLIFGPKINLFSHDRFDEYLNTLYDYTNSYRAPFKQLFCDDKQNEYDNVVILKQNNNEYFITEYPDNRTLGIRVNFKNPELSLYDKYKETLKIFNFLKQQYKEPAQCFDLGFTKYKKNNQYHAIHALWKFNDYSIIFSFAFYSYDRKHGSTTPAIITIDKNPRNFNKSLLSIKLLDLPSNDITHSEECEIENELELFVDTNFGCALLKDSYNYFGSVDYPNFNKSYFVIKTMEVTDEDLYSIIYQIDLLNNTFTKLIFDSSGSQEEIVKYEGKIADVKYYNSFKY